MKPVAWIKMRELSYMKAVAEHGKDDWQTNLGLKPEPDDEGLYTETQVQQMIKLLERCENEIRMTDRELMQQALELLNDINQCSLPPTGIPLPAEIDHVMEVLRTRLAQPDLAAVGEVGVWDERQWQGLTDEQIQQIEMSASSKLSAIYLAEAQLKGKNA